MKNITYRNIKLGGISKYGIVIDQAYARSGARLPRRGVPITDFKLTNITGHGRRQGHQLIFINPREFLQLRRLDLVRRLAFGHGGRRAPSALTSRPEYRAEECSTTRCPAGHRSSVNATA